MHVGSRIEEWRLRILFVICALALAFSTGRVRAQLMYETDKGNRRNSDTLEPETVMEDLSEGFYSDVDSVSIAVGGYHTCALEYRPGIDFGGPVRCWGRNDWGQSSPSDDVFVQVSAGDRHTCGIKVDQTVSCWGHMRFAPRGLFRQLSVGGHHTCALRREGGVVCWGDDIEGSISDVPKDTTFVQVVAGRDNSCGLLPNGRVTCWGSNSMGQSSPPRGEQFRQLSASNSRLPEEDIQFVSNIEYLIDDRNAPYGMYGVRITNDHAPMSFYQGYGYRGFETPLWPPVARYRHVCGVTLGGAIRCWGRDMRGETQVRKGPWNLVTCGQWTTCGIRQTDGGVECWGLRKINKTTSFYDEVSSGDYHTCAVTTEGELECWGSAQRAEQVPASFLTA